MNRGFIKYDGTVPEVSYPGKRHNPHEDNIEIRDLNRTDYSGHDARCKSETIGEIGSFGEPATLRPHSSEVQTTTLPLNSTLHLPPVSAHDIGKPRVKHPLLSGWRVGALVSLVGAIAVFILNLILTVWIWKNSKYKKQDGLGTLFEGSCTTTRRLNIWVHVLVNALSTLMLSASNYCMQVLCSPNREEVDNAHSRRFWLHIGVPSIHNLRYIGRERSFLWATLMLSSMPLHLLYNSVVFTNLQANSYVVVPTMDDWLFGGTYDFTNFLGFDDRTQFESALSAYHPDFNETITLDSRTTLPRYRNTSTEDCFHSFNTQYTSELGNVYIAQSNPTTWRNQTLWHLGVDDITGGYLWYTGEKDGKETKQVNTEMPFQSTPKIYPSNGWRCPPFQDTSCDFPKASEDWKPYESSVRYCMIEQVPEVCKLQFSFVIVSIVLISNLVNAACISRLLFCRSSRHALVTLGDAVASFLERPDVHTYGRCLPSEVQIDRAFNGRTFVAPQNDLVRYFTRRTRELENQPRTFKQEKMRWSAASSYGTWIAAYVLYSCVLIFGVVSMIMLLRGMPKSTAQLWKIGFGSVDRRTLLAANVSLLGGVIVANLPQAILSYLYITFNRIYTSMLLGKEWSSYLHERKTLRVTTPLGQQRSTYWLSLPYCYAIMMIIFSFLLHWLASQSLYMVQINVTRTKGSGPREIVPTEHISTFGFSPLAIILMMATATIIAVAGVIMGRFKYPAGMPLASSCSAVMSAACHPLGGDVNAHMLPVRWGATIHGSTEDERVNRRTGHCGFSSLSVEMPIPGRLYA